jgi:Mrp family chromosome partitioning ATPase
MRSLRGMADVIVIDAPPLWTPELSQIAGHAQGFLVVARKSAPQLPDLADALSQSGPSSVGFVLTV